MAIGGGLLALGEDVALARSNIADRLMSDKDFAAEFRGGSFMDIHDKYAADYMKLANRESRNPLAGIRDFYNSFASKLELGAEVAKRGVSSTEAIGNYAWQRKLSIPAELAAIGWGVYEMQKQAKQQHKEERSVAEKLVSEREQTSALNR